VWNVWDGRRNAHVTLLRSAGKCKLTASGDHQARPQKGKAVSAKKNCGQLQKN